MAWGGRVLESAVAAARRERRLVESATPARHRRDPRSTQTQDIGKGRYQYYAFLARDPGSAETEEKPDGTVPFLKKTFEGWSPDIHAILDATREDEIEQRDLYDRPPSSLKP